MKGNSGFQIGTGVTSVLMIFVILCLTTFGVLSYTSAEAELHLTEKNADYVTEYYEASSLIVDNLAQLDEMLYCIKNLLEFDSNEEYFKHLKDYLDELGDEELEVTYIPGEESIEATFKAIINDELSFNMVVRFNSYDVNERYTVISNYVYSEGGQATGEEELPDMWGG
ncbi:MAG: hypothetical protein IJP13_05195 [Lachnospiraceae bacterium]|nr:hypothetical protein [Lachnospiraceae bacterium]